MNKDVFSFCYVYFDFQNYLELSVKYNRFFKKIKIFKRCLFALIVNDFLRHPV